VRLELELAAALKRNIRVIPVLAEGASMPRFDELPADLKALAGPNALQIGDTDFDADYHRLSHCDRGSRAHGIAQETGSALPETGDKVQASYANRASILQAWGHVEEAKALLKKEEALNPEVMVDSVGALYV
jgi:hypothetical protein